MKRIAFAVLLLLCGIAALLLVGKPFDLRTSSTALASLEPAFQSERDRGIATFGFGDFGALSTDTLKTSAVPWKLAVSALALQQTHGDLNAVGEVDISALFRTFGFHSPGKIANWPSGLSEPDLSKPVGLNTGLASHDFLPTAVTIANTGCAACHASVTYTADGTPDTERIWLGMPNSSINLEAYASALFSAFKTYGDDSGLLLETVQQLFPETTWQERQTLRIAILPLLQKEIVERQKTFGRLLPFSAGLPGATNGLDALKNQLDLIPDGATVEKSAFNSIPDLGERHWRRSFLNSAVYAPPGSDLQSETRPEDLDNKHLQEMASVIAYFTVPSMGVSGEVAEAHIEDAEAVLQWLTTYRPQPFPGQIDRTQLQLGQSVYAAKCSRCHGVYNSSLETPELISFPNWLGDVGTDRRLMELTDESVAEAVNAGLFGRYISAKSTGAYAAPPLTGIWASAPYLHNGSVPTLWHLMRPDQRPHKFVVGGHSLDMKKVGIRGQKDGNGGWMPGNEHIPWSLAAEIDVSTYGLGAQGHESEFKNLTEDQKDALLEYLKLL
ncbi:hypothetical protein [uncultured Roseibium sp.]|uniref:c-type cytochrome n=1 Tax=uncultured Roseibium sp. TaxID=1936171 RepID=UPI002621AEFE|nr:hypothetical protein [uncultured Roseibium sp.]